MKTRQTKTKTLIGAAQRRTKPRFDAATASMFPAQGHQSLIQWPTDRQIQAVSARLARISTMGIRSEAKGDYFHSGDLAYQLHEIIRTTEELFKKTQRLGQ